MILLFFAVVGMLLGNFSTTVLYRIPRNISLAGLNSPPMCSVCRCRLSFYQYLPPMSWCFNHCLKCKAKINKIYRLLEIAGMCGSVLLYLLFGVQEISIILLVHFIVMNLSMALWYEHKRYYKDIALFIIFLGVIKSVLINGSIFPIVMIMCALSIFILCMLRKRKVSDKMVIHSFIVLAWSPILFPLIVLLFFIEHNFFVKRYILYITMTSGFIGSIILLKL